jgi:hypothetical protein
MSILTSDYVKCIELSERVAWRVDDVVSPGAKLDFGKSFMPSAMCFYDELPFLSSTEKLKLNQIYGNAYSYLFYFVEAYIITMAMEHARAELYGNDENLRAMLRFAEEEVKHQQLFTRFRELFDHQFGHPCVLVEGPQAVAEVILSKSPLAVLLVTLHLEIVTQAHYIDCMKDNQDMDAQFQSLFKHHWLEESQHAKLDVLELLKLRQDAEPELVQQAIDDYFDICTAFAGLLGAQAKLDLPSLERATARTFTPEQAAQIERSQRRGYHRAFLWYGFKNSLFQEFLAEYFPHALSRAEHAAANLG